MPRKADPTRKPELLGQILDHLTGRTLATVSFRTLAEALGVSTYVFVYHFGSRAELIEEIVRAIVARHGDLLRTDVTGLDDEAWRALMATAWRELSSDHSLQLQRLEFEAAMLEIVEGRSGGVARGAVSRWRDFTSAWAVSRGVEPRRADLEAGLFADALYGLRYDAMATGETDRATEAFEVLVDSFACRIESLVSVAAGRQ